MFEIGYKNGLRWIREGVRGGSFVSAGFHIEESVESASAAETIMMFFREEWVLQWEKRRVNNATVLEILQREKLSREKKYLFVEV